jgi:polysaccharide export outer membrane protein
MDLLENERELKVGDRLLYRVLEEREPPMILFVNDRGEIRVPLVGLVPAKGKTPQQEKDYFHRATVLLTYHQADNSRGTVNVAGAVRWQRAYPIPTDQIMTVTGAIIAAGGIAVDGESSKVELVRRNFSEEGDEVEVRQIVDVKAIMESGEFDKDLPVQDGDLVLVPRSTSVGGTVFVVGAVNSPGILNVPPDGSLTLSKAILQSGGFSRFARRQNVKLIRGDSSIPENERTQVVNVEEILQKGLRDQDPVVKPNDIIRVEERLIAF